MHRLTVEIVAGRTPVCIGTCENTTSEMIDLTGNAKDAGADFVSILTPYFVTPDEEELFDHFAAVAEAVDIGIILYSNPPRTHVPMPTPLVARLAEAHPNIIGIKDSSGDLTQTMDYIAACPEDFCVLCGRDSIIFSALLNGADGAISACADVVPELVVGIYESFLQGDLTRARELQFKLLPFRNAFSLGTFPSVIKAAMNLCGLPAGPTRKPIAPLKAQKLRVLKDVLANMGCDV